MVSVTYGHGFLHDCNTLVTDGGSEGKWTETDANNIATWAVDSDDYFKVTVTPTANAQTANLSYHLATNLLGLTYTKLLVRWKTPSETTSPGVKAGLIITYLTGDPETTDLGYHLLFKVNTITVDPARTIDKIAFKVTSDGATTGTFIVWFDFFLIVKNIFVFPNATHHFVPPPLYALTPIPGRVVGNTQNLGSDWAEVPVSCDLNVGRLSTTASTCTGDDWKRPQGVDSEYQTAETEFVKGQVFMDIAHNSFQESWQWLDTGSEQFKATLERPDFTREARHSLDLVFREYSRSNKSNESYVERFGLNL